MKPVKKTRRIGIAEKIFTSEDLRRIAAIFHKESLLAEESKHHSTIEYQVQFEDATTLETDSPELFTDESLVSTSRPVTVNMSV